MNERTGQLQIDFRTGRPTGIVGNRISEPEWRSIALLNSHRAGVIETAIGEHSSRQSASADGWLEHVAGKAARLEVPLIPLSRLGLTLEGDGYLQSNTLTRMREGREASAWKDEQFSCVYKLFDLRTDGSLGMKLIISMIDEYECRVEYAKATITDVLTRQCTTHKAGACPTEIVGLSESCDYLICKQPFCDDYVSLEDDKHSAAENMKAVRPTGTYGADVWLYWIEDKAWILGDLHKGNIRRLHGSIPTVIDCLVGEVPPEVMTKHAAIGRAIIRAKEWRKGNKPKPEGLILNSDDDL